MRGDFDEDEDPEFQPEWEACAANGGCMKNEAADPTPTDLVALVLEWQAAAAEWDAVENHETENRIDNALIALRAWTPAAPSQSCLAIQTETGALCELQRGHAQNHRGAFPHGIAQWPRESTAALPPVEADTMPTIEVGDRIMFVDVATVTSVRPYLRVEHDGQSVSLADVQEIDRGDETIWRRPSPQEPT